LNTKYPFAHSKIRTDGKSIWYEKFGNIIKVDKRNQFDFTPILEPFLHKVEFGKNNLAERYFPLENSKNVVVDPQHQFGQPTITGTNIQTDFIFKLHNGGETKRNIAILYDLKVKQVTDALLYHKQIA